MTTFEKLLSILNSRRFWLSLLIVLTTIGGAFNVELLTVDPEEAADSLMPLLDAVRLLVIAIVPVFMGSRLISAYTDRPAGKDDA